MELRRKKEEPLVVLFVFALVFCSPLIFSFSRYVAPEVLTNTGYGPGVDLWSIGVITYILLCGFPPFYGDTIPEMFEQIMSGKFDFPAEYWGSISSNAKDFISKLLVVDTKKRLTAQQALDHPWLKPKVSFVVLLREKSDFVSGCSSDKACISVFSSSADDCHHQTSGDKRVGNRKRFLSKSKEREMRNKERFFFLSFFLLFLSKQL